MRAIIAAALAGAFLAPGAIAAPSANALFDPPLATQKRALPAAKGAPKATLTCNYYPRFMVKQIDEGEVGAAQLSIVAGDAAHKPACQRANLPGEKVIDPRDWSGYFKGVKGDYALFDSEDGVNGALGFAIFAADGKKLFEDSAIGDFRAGAGARRGAALLTPPCYGREVFGRLLAVPHDGAGCWSKIAATRTGSSEGPRLPRSRRLRLSEGQARIGEGDAARRRAKPTVGLPHRRRQGDRGAKLGRGPVGRRL